MTPSPPRRHRARRAVVIGGATLVLAAIGYTALGQVGRSEETTTASVPGVREVVVDIDAGPVAVRAGTGPDVGIRTTRHSSLLGAPLIGHRLVDGVLTITAACPTFGPNCHVEEQVTVPAGVPVQVRTSAGSVEGTDLDLPRFDVETSAGSVSASFVRPPQEVRVETSAGSVQLRVPDVAYRVDADTSVGQVRIGVAQDPSAPRSLHVDTSAGSVTILPR